MYQIYIIQFSKIRHLLQFWSSFNRLIKNMHRVLRTFLNYFPKFLWFLQYLTKFTVWLKQMNVRKFISFPLKKFLSNQHVIKPSTNSISIRIASQSFSKISNYIISHLLSQFHQQIHINPNKHLLKLALPTPRFSFNDPTLISIPKVHGTFK